MAATGAGLRRICALLALAGAAACSEPNELIRVSAVAYVAGGPVDFGEVPVGEAREVLVEVHNPGRVPFALRSLKEHGNPSFIVVNEDDVVPSFSSRKVWLRFRPLDEGVHQDEVRIDTDGAVEDRLLPVKGTGVPAPIVIDPPVLDFQTLEVDSDRVLEVTVTNPVGLPAELTFSGDGASQFSREVAEVPAYSTVKVPIRFHPDALGPQQARLEARVCARCTPATNESRGNSVPHAFLFNPTPVPFEPVPVHAHSPSYVELTNITWRPVTVGELLPSDQAFAALTTLRGLRLAPGETTRIDLQFSARQHGPAVGTLDVHYQSDRARRAQVTLDARGGRPQLALTPITVDFGELPVGGKAEQVVRLSNAGSTGALHFAGVRATGAIAQFGVSRPIRAGREEAWSAGSAWPELAANDLPIQPGADH
ncbi:MAG: choice-of-anchor D domain-containing protein, partial [Myxococcales bacterium]